MRRSYCFAHDLPRCAVDQVKSAGSWTEWKGREAKEAEYKILPRARVRSSSTYSQLLSDVQSCRGSAMLSHYDRRYFHGIATDEERRDTQSHMVRAYLTFFRTNKLDTWIAHGTLLGWWWNGKVNS
jgi:hypothetical protein